MKINAFNPTKFVTFGRFLPVVLILVLGLTGCNRKPKWGTVLPGKSSGVSDSGLTGTPQGGRNPANDLNTRPIAPINPIDTTGTSAVPITPGGVDADASAQARNDWDALVPDHDKFAAQTVYFDFDKFNIKPGEVEKIKVVAAHLKANATHRVEVDGHCDERGTEEYNRALGEKRAQSIREFLVREGVSPDRVRTVSFGEDKPVDPGHTEAAWSKNRRGEFVLMTPK